MLRCIDVTKNVAENVSIYDTLFCNDVARYMYRNALQKHAEPSFRFLIIKFSYRDFS